MVHRAVHLLSLGLATRLADLQTCGAKSPQPPLYKGGTVLLLCEGGLRGIFTLAWLLAIFSNQCNAQQLDSRQLEHLLGGFAEGPVLVVLAFEHRVVHHRV